MVYHGVMQTTSVQFVVTIACQLPNMSDVLNKESKQLGLVSLFMHKLLQVFNGTFVDALTLLLISFPRFFLV